MARMHTHTRMIAGVILVALLAGAAGVVLYARGGGPLPAWLPLTALTAQDPLGQSRAPEAVLRTLRLAGFAHASVAENSGTAILRVRIPTVDSAADVEMTWQTAVSALSVAYSSAGRYVVQVFADDRGLVQVEWDGDDARSAIQGDDARALVASARFTMLTPGENAEGDVTDVSPADASVFDYVRRGLRGGATPLLGVAPPDAVASARALVGSNPHGATALPQDVSSIDLEYSGGYLDAKNRAAGLLGESGPTFEGADVLSDAATSMRGTAPGIPAIPPDVDAGLFWARLGTETLQGRKDAGSSDLINELESVEPELDAYAVSAIRAAAMAAIAVREAPLGTLLSRVAGSARSVAAEALDTGPLSDALLAAARDSRAPDSSRQVAAFDRDESLDRTREGEPDSAVAFSWSDAAKPEAPRTTERWRGYVRSDGRRYWLADDGETASSDASLLGWAFSAERAGLVDAADVGTVRAMDTGTPR